MSKTFRPSRFRKILYNHLYIVNFFIENDFLVTSSALLPWEKQWRACVGMQEAQPKAGLAQRAEWRARTGPSLSPMRRSGSQHAGRHAATKTTRSRVAQAPKSSRDIYTVSCLATRPDRRGQAHRKVDGLMPSASTPLHVLQLGLTVVVRHIGKSLVSMPFGIHPVACPATRPDRGGQAHRKVDGPMPSASSPLHVLQLGLTVVVRHIGQSLAHAIGIHFVACFATRPDRRGQAHRKVDGSMPSASTRCMFCNSAWPSWSGTSDGLMPSASTPLHVLQLGLTVVVRHIGKSMVPCHRRPHRCMFCNSAWPSWSGTSESRWSDRHAIGVVRHIGWSHPHTVACFATRPDRRGQAHRKVDGPCHRRPHRCMFCNSAWPSWSGTSESRWSMPSASTPLHVLQLGLTVVVRHIGKSMVSCHRRPHRCMFCNSARRGQAHRSMVSCHRRHTVACFATRPDRRGQAHRKVDGLMPSASTPLPTRPDRRGQAHRKVDGLMPCVHTVACFATRPDRRGQAHRKVDGLMPSASTPLHVLQLGLTVVVRHIGKSMVSCHLRPHRCMFCNSAWPSWSGTRKVDGSMPSASTPWQRWWCHLESRRFAFAGELLCGLPLGEKTNERNVEPLLVDIAQETSKWRAYLSNTTGTSWEMKTCRWWRDELRAFPRTRSSQDPRLRCRGLCRLSIFSRQDESVGVFVSPPPT